MLDDLYAGENEAIVNDMIARPAPAKPQATKFSAWKAATGLARGPAAGAAESAGFASDVLGAFGQVLGAYPEILGGDLTPEQRRQADEQRGKLKTQGIDYSSEGGDLFRGVAKSYMPDPATAHTAENLSFGLGRFATKAVGYVALGGPLIGAGLTGFDEAMTTADELKQQGVDEATRTKVGAVAGLAGAAGVLVPAAGKTLAQTAGLVAAGGPGAYIAQQAVTRKILQDADYSSISTQYNPFDPVGLAVATLVPAGFGAFSLRGARLHGERLKAEGEAAAAAQENAKAAAEIGPPRPSPEQVDAARVEMLSQHLEKSGLFKPDDARAAALHVEAYARAMDDLSAGRRVDVTDLVPVERLEMSKALDTFARGLEDSRTELLSQAALRAEPGAVRQMQAELADAQVQLAGLEDTSAIKARAGELQRSDRLSYKQALSQAQKEFGAQADDVRARVSRLESLIEDNATATQAIDALGRIDQQAEQVKQQRTQVDAPATRQTATSAAAREVVSTTKGPSNDSATGSPVGMAAGAGRDAGASPASGLGDVGSGAPKSGLVAEPRTDVVSKPAGAAENGRAGSSDALTVQANAARLAEIQTQFPDLTVQMDGMDGPVKLADFLAEVQREALEGTDFELGGNDAPLMQVAATCFLLNG